MLTVSPVLKAVAGRRHGVIVHGEPDEQRCRFVFVL